MQVDVEDRRVDVLPAGDVHGVLEARGPHDLVTRGDEDHGRPKYVTKEKKDDDEDDGDEEMRMKNEHRLADDPANWWAPDSACVQAMVRSAGFDVEAQITHETWMCTASRSPHRFITRELDAIRRR